MMKIADGGCLEWRNHKGQIHRDDDLPARIWPDGCRIWYRDGLVHRDDGPAYVGSDGYEAWFEYGQQVTGDIADIEQFPLILDMWERLRDSSRAIPSGRGWKLRYG